jgi:hypothetical protein
VTEGGIYVADPIDQRGPDIPGHLFEAIEQLTTAAITGRVPTWVFDPGDAFRVNPHAQPDDTIARINRAVAENAAVVVFSDIRASWVLTYPPSIVARYHSWENDDVADAVVWLHRQGDDLGAPGA